jgi:competence protein ComEA
MNADKLNRFWLVATFLLIIIILASSLTIWVRRDKGQPILISNPPSPQIYGEVYIEGAVANPGIYSLQASDSIESLVQAAGGADENADLARVQFFVPGIGEVSPPQQININLAEEWLLQALPGIGEIRARAIIDYRRQNGPFRSIEELTKVPGISGSIFQNLKGQITIGK